MANTHWGVDSCAPATTALASSVRSFSNGLAYFWGRYFSPVGTSGCTAMDNEGGGAASEAAAMKGIGVRFIVPLTTPGSQRTGTKGNTGNNNGYADGSAAANAINTACKNSGYKIVLPGNLNLRVYLDIEAGQSFTTDYWQGWWAGVFSTYDYTGSLSFHPSCYCDPLDGNACSVLTSSPSYYPYAVWSSEPENYQSPYCSVPGPSWAPDKCSGIYTVLWQYAEPYVNCTNFSGFDLDESTPGEDEAAYMLYLP